MRPRHARARLMAWNEYVSRRGGRPPALPQPYLPRNQVTRSDRVHPMALKMTPDQITDFVLSHLMMRGKPTEDGSLGATLTVECQQVEIPSNFTLLWSSEHARPDDVIDINRIRIWSHDRLLFDAEFLDSEFGSKRYRISAFERGTWLDVVASALILQLHEEGDAIRH
jgi:hypothetical protein